MTMQDAVCQVCGQSSLYEVEGFAALPRITSDCRAFPPGGSLYVCLICGAVQKMPDANWLREIDGIYAGYEAYYQSGGEEQIVFDRATGMPRRRSDVILANMHASTVLPLRGRALDIGCGNGATLVSMSTILPDWSLNGYELGKGALPRLQNIPRFERLYTGSINAIDQQFDLVSMVHSLEHFPCPLAVLEELKPIVGCGKLFIEVCNVDHNPFDILIADHLMHFNPATLARLLWRAGFSPTSISTDWVAKEISLLAKVGVFPQADGKVDAAEAAATYVRLNGYVAWLRRLLETALVAAEGVGNFGLFGTSIAATWLAPQLMDRISFFVDEDRNRIGREHLGRPVIHPGDVPGDARVLLALAPNVAHAIASRLDGLSCALIMPPPLAD